jgi:hypothetical protein
MGRTSRTQYLKVLVSGSRLEFQMGLTFLQILNFSTKGKNLQGFCEAPLCWRQSRSFLAIENQFSGRSLGSAAERPIFTGGSLSSSFAGTDNYG